MLAHNRNLSTAKRPKQVQFVRPEDDSRDLAERAVISALVQGPSKPSELDLEPSHFANRVCQKVFQQLCIIERSGRPTNDTVILAQELGKAVSYAELQSVLGAGSGAHAIYYAKQLREIDRSVQVGDTTLKIQQRIERGEDYADLVARFNQLNSTEPPPNRLVILSAAETLAKRPGMRPVIIDGIVRRGETVNVIAAPKMGKSWLVLGLALAVANGRKWLHWQTKQGRCLIIDNELHGETFEERLAKASEASGLSAENIDYITCRGDSITLGDVLLEATTFGKDYSLIVLDAFYRFIPPGTSENDNAQMMQLYNSVDAIAKLTGAAVALIHHTSKGSQAEKAVTDIGSGAGSISRAADTHLILRPHEIAGSAVLEAVTRSFVSPEPKSIVFDYPCWRAAEFEPEVKGAKRSSNKDRVDAETREAILGLIKAADGKPVTLSRLRNRTGFGLSRVQRGAMLLESSGEAKRTVVKSRQNAKRVDALKWVSCTETCTETCTDIFHTSR